MFYNRKVKSVNFSFLIIILLILISLNGYSQLNKSVDSIKNVVSKILDDAVVHEKIKDSTAVYALTILMDVKLEGKEQLVEVTTNNPKFSPGLDFVCLDKLKKIDFRSLMKDKKAAKFSFKVYFAVYDSKYNHKVKLEDVAKSIQDLILRDEFGIHNLGFKLTIFDKTVYH